MKNRAPKPQWPSFYRICFLLNERWKKPLLPTKKRRKNRHFGNCFFQSAMEIAKQKLGSAEDPSHAWPSQKGMAIGQNIGLSRRPKIRRKAVFFFRRKKCGIFHALHRTYLKNRSKIGFSVAFPFWKKEKREKKRIGLVFNLWETHKGTNVGPAKKWLEEVPFFGTPHKCWWSRAINVLQAFCTWWELFVKE